MLQIKKNKSGNLKLFVNDEEVVAKINFDRNRDAFTLITGELSTVEQILNHKFDELPDIYYLAFPISSEWSKPLVKINILQSKIDKFEIRFSFSSKANKWRNKKNYFRYFSGFSFSVTDFNVPNSDTRKNFKEENLRVKLNTSQSMPYGFEVIFTAKTLSFVLREEVDRYLKILHYFHNQALKIANSDSKEKTILSSFIFPEELKIPCEQYLIYFAQFIRDLGINATSTLKEEAGKVLFSVTPLDDIEALDKIREALAVYLHLPSSPIVYDDSFAAMRLQQQIENLDHSQKMAVREIQLAEKVIMIQSETIQEKNTIIAQKDSTIEQQNKIIEKISSKSIMMDSVQDKEELEEIYDGLKIGESKFLKEQLGIHLNPAKVIKSAVKDTFGKDSEKKSVLGLNEE